jgi:undecaprenyl pyrophosphate synthase
VVEPEVVDEKERQIHYPYAVLKNKLQEVLKLYKESIKLRPPENVKILSEASFLTSNEAVSPEEFEVLMTLTEWTNPNDIYRQCPLLDHEITQALVSLRKKGALKIIAAQNNP